jgi:hypothetical protein
VPRDAPNRKERAPRDSLNRKEVPTMADDPTKGKSPTWPNGEPQKVRDAYDKAVAAGKGKGK